MYQKPKAEKLEHLFRIRWQFPDQHLDKNGNPMKYQSPIGSGQHLYFPEMLRKAYQTGRPIRRLFLQEGEKKAEKACKHGLMSVGLMGINSIGHNGRLPHEINLIIQRCQVEEVVFIMDSDWDQLSKNLTVEKPLEQRSWSFYVAVKNFKGYFQTLKNQNIFLELYFGYYHADKQHKGIDDQLVGPFRTKEPEVLADIERAINEKDGKGDFYTMHKITTEVDSKILKLWHLESAQAFATFHKETIMASGLKEFTIFKNRRRFDENFHLELAQPIVEDEKFWDDQSFVDKNGNTHEKIAFKYSRCYKFLYNRGFGRINMKSGKWEFAKMDNKVVRLVDAGEIKDFMINLAKEVCSESVMDMLYRGGKMYFGPDSLSNIDFMQPTFKHTDKDSQFLYFKDKAWRITALGIEEKPLTELESFVWADKLIDRTASKIDQKLVDVHQITQADIDALPVAERLEWQHHLGEYSVDLSEEAKRSHYIQFLVNSSNFYWKSTEQVGMREQFETNRHLVSKMTAFGYMMHKYRNKSCEKAVICMDGKLSEVGESNGRSGKSLFGMGLDKMMPVTYINAKAKNLTEDQFWAEEVTEKTDIIFLDDVRANIDFEFFFPVITGKLTVNGKGAKKFTLSEEDTPKMLITTNHAISGNSGSYKDRQFLLAFSDFYNETHKPVDDFGLNFWSEWDGTEQWNLFYNFMAQCIELYLQIGLVHPILDRLEKRRMLQFIGEDFMSWASDYYGTFIDMDPNEIFSNSMNKKVQRTDLFNDFCFKNPQQKKYVTPTKFKKKLKGYCDYMGLRFNPHINDKEGQPGGDDKSGGVEWITIANDRYL
jgi:hypothetical protein